MLHADAAIENHKANVWLYNFLYVDDVWKGTQAIGCTNK